MKTLNIHSFVSFLISSGLFDFKGKSSETADGKSQGSFDIVGGSGKWKGAIGKGKFVRIEKSGDTNKTSFEMEITIP